MNQLRKLFLHSPELERYPYPADCPFNTARAGRTRSTLASMGLLSGGLRVEVAPAPAPRSALEKLHAPEYLDALATAPQEGPSLTALRMGLGTPDCPIFAGMYEYSALAAGATLLGAQQILAGAAGVAFNPSGGLHHAAPARASGFCYINDVALACLLLSEARDRVLFVDVDVHHGDGVQNAFYDRADVMTISFHESGRTLFPGTGAATDIGRGAGRGFSVNVPLPVGTYDLAYLRAFRDVAMPLARAYDPAVIVLEVGADGLAGDPLAHLQLTNNVYAEVVHLLRSLQRPILATGGGGYHIDNTVRAWALVWTALCDEDEGPDLQAGMGGVMLESTDWLGGLRDRALLPDAERRAVVDAAVAATVREVAALVFPIHGLDAG